MVPGAVPGCEAGDGLGDGARTTGAGDGTRTTGAGLASDASRLYPCCLYTHESGERELGPATRFGSTLTGLWPSVLQRLFYKGH